MPRIQQLSPTVVAQIAAGEVIERAASVVKELVENSIDAGASRIDIEVGQGGTEFIRVVDDGGGIHPEDLALAFSAHATSKLHTADDLFRLGTLGFRGEGLASVGGIAQVTLQSRQPTADHGAEVHCHGGVVSPPRVWNGRPGTRIEVRHLFFNVPARRKFQRGPAAEMAHVTETFIRLALAQLGRHLTLRHNGRMVHDVPASAGLLDRLGQFFGADLRRRLHMVEAEANGLTLGGYVADPIHEQGGGALQYLFVNGRCVRDRGVAQALQEAYRGLLMTQRHPVAFLFLESPPEEVDVNVHPTKSEVRFRHPERVTRLVQETVRARLTETDLTAPLRVREAPARPTPAHPPAPELPFAPPPRPPSDHGVPARTTPGHRGHCPAFGPLSRALAPTPPASTRRPPVAQPSAPVPTTDPVRTRPPLSGPPLAGQRVLKAVQMHDLYLVVEVPDGILVIDQHALHERILYEQLKERHTGGRIEVQKLLIPEPVTLPPAQAALVLEHRGALARLGLEVEDFGRGTVLIGGYPAVLGKRQPRDVLSGVVEYLLAKERPPSADALLDDLLALMACHAAVRAGDRLTPEEITELAERRDLARDTHHCPHGRPTSLHFSRTELDRQFRRT